MMMMMMMMTPLVLRKESSMHSMLMAYSPVNRTGSPQGFSQGQISHKLNTIHKRKTYKHNFKVSPFGIALVENGK